MKHSTLFKKKISIQSFLLKWATSERVPLSLSKFLSMRLLYTLLFLSFVGAASAQTIQVQPNGAVRAAFTPEQLAWKSSEDVTELNFRASHLVAVEPAAKTTQADFQLKQLADGKIVTLSSAELMNLNPLLYNIPQDEVRCNNFYVASKEGSVFLLVVLSKQQYAQQLNQYKRSQNTKK